MIFFGLVVSLLLFYLFACFDDGNLQQISEDCFGQCGHFANVSYSSHEHPVLPSPSCSVLRRA